MEITVGSRLKHAWNAFLNRDPTNTYRYGMSGGYSYRPDPLYITPLKVAIPYLQLLLNMELLIRRLLRLTEFPIRTRFISDKRFE